MDFGSGPLIRIVQTTEVYRVLPVESWQLELQLILSVDYNTTGQ